MGRAKSEFKKERNQKLVNYYFEVLRKPENNEKLRTEIYEIVGERFFISGSRARAIIADVLNG